MLTLESSHDEYLAEIERVRVMYKLKGTMRYLSMRDTAIHSESVAEHIFGMQLLALYFLKLEGLEGKLDRARVDDLILFHELGEVETGDIINHQKTDEHREQEKIAAMRVAAMLPDSLKEYASACATEFEEHTTPEGEFAWAIDKMEPIFEMWDEQVALPLFKKYGYTRANAIDNKIRATEKYPYMRRFIEAWDNRAVALDIFPS